MTYFMGCLEPQGWDDHDMEEEAKGFSTSVASVFESCAWTTNAFKGGSSQTVSLHLYYPVMVQVPKLQGIYPKPFRFQKQTPYIITLHYGTLDL